MKPILFSTPIDEIWKPILGYEGRYEISNYGQVRSLDSLHDKHRGKIMAQFSGPKGYKYIDLRNKTGKKAFAVHRLVLEAFVCPKPEGKQVAHWDGNPSNNFEGNLRWATARENIEDRERHGRTAKGENSGSAKLDTKCVKTIMKLKELGFSTCEVGHLACVSATTIQRIWNGESWRNLQ
ncbi:MAG: NUMOD4 motif-containing HNH endonuclease [Candidatus Babeliales bacterium]